MPELPEVETVRIGLQKLIVGKQIEAVQHDWPKSFPNDPDSVNQFVVGATVTTIKRRAKVLMIELDSNYSLVVHLKMTGQLVYRGKENWGAGHPSDSLIGHLPDKSTRVEIDLTDGSKLFFNDQRKFGWMRLLPTPEVPNIDFMKKVGPEPLSAKFTKSVFMHQLARRSNSRIKTVLLDQTVLAGIGNIYADESLFLAGIHPESKVGKIPKARINKLHQAIIDVLELSLEKGGSTDRNYISAEGKRGSYIDFANVFRKQNQPCPVCSTPIIKTKVAGRGTHICRKCQKEYK